MNIFTPDIAADNWYMWGMYITFMIALTVAILVLIGNLIHFIVRSFIPKKPDSLNDAWFAGGDMDDDAIDGVAFMIFIVIFIVLWPLTILAVVAMAVVMIVMLRADRQRST
jgi:hypothetical protein